MSYKRNGLPKSYNVKTESGENTDVVRYAKWFEVINMIIRRREKRI